MKKYFLIITIFLLALLAWSPWQTKESAENTAMSAFELGQAGIIDGCGLSCEGCGIESSQKIPFGYLVKIKYKCGMKDYFRRESKFVTSVGIPLTLNK